MSTRRRLSEATRQRLREQAQFRCSYCRSPEWVGIPMVIDHITPLAAGGTSDPMNLCLCCYRCNEFKGAKTEALDVVTAEMIPLFNPMTQTWNEHFVWIEDGLVLAGQTACGRATVDTLQLNHERLTRARQIWKLAGFHPPFE